MHYSLQINIRPESYSNVNLDSSVNRAEDHCCLIQETCYFPNMRVLLCPLFRGKHTTGRLIYRPALRRPRNYGDFPSFYKVVCNELWHSNVSSLSDRKDTETSFCRCGNSKPPWNMSSRYRIFGLILIAELLDNTTRHIGTSSSISL